MSNVIAHKFNFLRNFAIQVSSIDQHKSKSCTSLGYNINHDIIPSKHESRQEINITFYVELHAVDVHRSSSEFRTYEVPLWIFAKMSIISLF